MVCRLHLHQQVHQSTKSRVTHYILLSPPGHQSAWLRATHHSGCMIATLALPLPTLKLHPPKPLSPYYYANIIVQHSKGNDHEPGQGLPWAASSVLQLPWPHRSKLAGQVVKGTYVQQCSVHLAHLVLPKVAMRHLAYGGQLMATTIQLAIQTPRQQTAIDRCQRTVWLHCN